MKTQLIAGLILLTSLTANAGDNKRAWDNDNNPNKMGFDYITRTYSYDNTFEALPLEGSLTKAPWSGDYWPTYKGGITYRWNSDKSTNENIAYDLNEATNIKSLDALSKLSPSEKYDLFLGRTDFPLTSYERERTNVLKTIPGTDAYDSSFKIPTWEGLCHAWAPATILFDSPSPVVVKGLSGQEIPFGASDIKALLTYHLHHNKAQTQFLGGRCNVDLADLKRQLQRGEITKAQYNRVAENGACEDTNAGAFHIVLTNQIALKDQGFIADVTRDLEVWNQAVHSYETSIISTKMGASKKAAPGTVKEITVLTKMHYTVEIQHSYDETSEYNSTYTKSYRYTLELDKNGRIIGGEWISEDRPDFLWKQDLPKWDGFFAPLEEIYKASVSK